MHELIANLLSVIANRRSDEGATAVEYGLMVALIAAVVIAGATLLGTNANNIFNTVAAAITAA